MVRGWHLHTLAERVDSALMSALAVILSHDEVAHALDALAYEERVKLLSQLMSVTVTTRDPEVAAILQLGSAGTAITTVETEEDGS